MQSISATPWQTSYYPIPKYFYTHHLPLNSSYYFSTKIHLINKSFVTLTATNRCSKEQESQRKNPENNQCPCEKDQFFFQEFYSSIKTPKSQNKEDLETADIDWDSSLGISMGGQS